LAFVHLGTSSNNNKKVEVDNTKNTKVEKTKEEKPTTTKTNVQSKPANNTSEQLEAEKASGSELQDHVKNVVVETDHVHSPSHNKENLAEQTPITNEQMSLVDSVDLVDSAATTVVSNEPTVQQAPNTIEIVESDSPPASNTNVDKPKLIQPKVIRNDQPVQSKTEQGSGSSKQPQASPSAPAPQQAGKTAKPSPTQKKADLDAGGNFFVKRNS
jgi:hypothetical protein